MRKTYTLFHGLDGISGKSHHEKAYRLEAGIVSHFNSFPDLLKGLFLVNTAEYSRCTAFDTERDLIATGFPGQPEELTVNIRNIDSRRQSPGSRKFFLYEQSAGLLGTFDVSSEIVVFNVNIPKTQFQHPEHLVNDPAGGF